MGRIKLHPEVGEALRMGRPVVALESAVITAGLPRRALDREPSCAAPGWRTDQPINLETALLLDRSIRQCNAIPAVVAILDGTIHVGLDVGQLEALARDDAAGKVSASGLAGTMTSGHTAGTTVSATLAVCARYGPIRVFATGGIGGVHRDWQILPDVSGDLEQLARTQTCVVSSGAKSILDQPATLQRLESLNVPVVGYRCDHVPCFHTRGSESLRVPLRLDDVKSIVRLCRTHWRELGHSTGVLVANPVPESAALDQEELETAIRTAHEQARSEGVSGASLTPFLLAKLDRLTGGRTLEANIALLVENARLASELARAFAEDSSSRRVR